MLRAKDMTCASCLVLHNAPFFAGRAILPSAAPYAVAALDASAAPLRRLGCRQLGHIVQVRLQCLPQWLPP